MVLSQTDTAQSTCNLVEPKGVYIFTVEENYLPYCLVLQLRFPLRLWDYNMPQIYGDKGEGEYLSTYL